ncbi:hypothetical protein P4646_09530 [Peribacillus simplex]|uniref:hypothetical protein n=1 Tax=Peribacillus simplex TaxID=1478 RepID=UPI002E1DC311|nr:hypothetical protein [Peribacillus simplex]MED4097073.1 hypothetical protein [Peribacillus simplex]
MYLEIVKTDFLYLDGAITSFTLTPLKNRNGTNKVRVDSAVEFTRTNEQNNKVLGGHIIYNLNDCNLEMTTIPPNTKFTFDSIENSISFEYKHMNIPLGNLYKGNAGRWNLILPEGWKLTELYLSDPYHNEEDVKKKKQFRHSVFWDTQKHTQLIEMDLLSKRGSFSFIIKGKALNITNIPEQSQIDFIPCYESDFGLRTLSEVHFHTQNINILDKINKYVELKPNIGGLSININEIISDLLSKIRFR